MPRCAIISVLILMAGTLAASAAPFGTEMRNKKFQPDGTARPVVLRPSSVTVMRPSGVKVMVKRPAVFRPAQTALNPAQVPAAP